MPAPLATALIGFGGVMTALNSSIAVVMAALGVLWQCVVTWAK